MRSGLTTTYVTSSAATVRPIFCVYMDFSTGGVSSPVRLTNALNNITITDDFGGGSYTAVGTLGNIDVITETQDLAAKSVNLSLSAIPSEMMSLALNSNYRGRTICIYLLLYNAAYSAYDQTAIFRGRMNTMSIAESGDSSVITLSCESHLVDMNRPRERRYTDEEQKRMYPGDRGLEYLAASAGMDIWWGSASPNPNTGQPNYAANHALLAGSLFF